MSPLSYDKIGFWVPSLHPLQNDIPNSLKRTVIVIGFRANFSYMLGKSLFSTGAILMSEKKVVFWPKLLNYILSSLFCKVVFSPHFRLYFLPTPIYDSQWVRFQFGTIFSTVPYNLNNLQSNTVSQYPRGGFVNAQRV